jgi:galactokinase
VQTFADIFGTSPVVAAEAPGRVNLIGEHTDYNGGYVLPTVIPQRTRVELLPRPDANVRVWSANVDEAHRMEQFVLGREAQTRTWLDYVQGVTVALRQRGLHLRGADVRIESTVPIGSGLSSSAALEVSVARALRAAFDLRLDDVELAMAGKWAENEFVGAPTGIMDQMVVSLGMAGAALFLDTRSLHFDRVPLPASVELVVIDSGVRHRIVSGEYATRRRQCEEASRRLGVPELRDVPASRLPDVESLDEPYRRRARHVVTEDERVLQAVAALRANDPAQVGELFYASHASMRDDYEVSVPAVDALVELASADGDVYGARLTGGGFGGAVVMLARAGQGCAVAARVSAAYAADTGNTPRVLVPEEGSGDRRQATG